MEIIHVALSFERTDAERTVAHRGVDLDEDELDESVSAAAGVVGDCTAAA